MLAEVMHVFVDKVILCIDILILFGFSQDKNSKLCVKQIYMAKSKRWQLKLQHPNRSWT